MCSVREALVIVCARSDEWNDASVRVNDAVANDKAYERESGRANSHAADPAAETTRGLVIGRAISQERKQ